MFNDVQRLFNVCGEVEDCRVYYVQLQKDDIVHCIKKENCRSMNNSRTKLFFLTNELMHVALKEFQIQMLKSLTPPNNLLPTKIQPTPTFRSGFRASTTKVQQRRPIYASEQPLFDCFPICRK